MWRYWTWRQEHGTNVRVTIKPGYVSVAGAVLLVTAYNDSTHAVVITSVAVEMNDGSKNVAIQPMLVPGATMPAEVGPHNSGIAWFGSDLMQHGFDPRRPVRAYVMLASRERPVWSKRRKLG